MGAPAQTNSQVYYDTDKGQYYTIEPQKNSMVSWIDLLANPNANRNYLGTSLQSSADRFTPKYVPTNYPDMNSLFPALNLGLLQGISSSVQPNGAMYGAGRFLSPQSNILASQTTSESKGK